MTTADDHVLARDLAQEAGRRLLTLRAGASGGGDPAALRDAGDRSSHEFLLSRLREARPGDVVLSEEGADDPARLTADRVWIVDPLDGTREFGDAGRTDWAVHVALWEHGPGLTAGAVALPAQGKVLSTANPSRPQPIPWLSQPRAPEPMVVTTTGFGRGGGEPGEPGSGGGPDPGEPGSEGAPDPGGAGSGGVGLAERGNGAMRIVVSRSRAPQFLTDIAARVGAEVSKLGSAGAKIAAVITGDFDAYLHAGGFYEWDTAAPVAVARAAGLHASRINGDELRYNQADLLMPDILVCRPGIAGRLLEAIREVTHAS